MSNNINSEDVRRYQHRLVLCFNDYVHLTKKLLSDNPHGLSLPTIQKVVGMPAKTAKRVLSLVADEKGDKYYPKSEGVQNAPNS